MKASLTIIVETFIPSIINLTFQSLNCIEIDSKKYFVEANTMIDCNSEEFIEWVEQILIEYFLKFYLERL